MKDKIEKCFEYQILKIQIINKSNQQYDYYAGYLKTSEWTKLAPVNAFNWIKWLGRGKKKDSVAFSPKPHKLKTPTTKWREESME